MIDADKVTVEAVDASSHPEFKNHEKLFRIAAPDCGVVGFVAVHSTALGVAEGGIRYSSYVCEDEAITDVLRLSEGMTLKNAAAGLKAGGGKSVVIAPEGKRKPDADILQVIACALNKVNADQPLYLGAEDMNISEENIDTMLGFTEFLKGATSHDPALVSGNPSPLTALGVFEAMKVAVEEVFGEGAGLQGRRVSLQGVGSVGGELAKLLYHAGAHLVACDMSDEAFDALSYSGVEVKRVGLEEIYDAKADIFAPNAIGGTLTVETVGRLEAAGVRIICGAANNQQRDQVGHKQSRLLHEKGMLYCPDFIVNAGGIIWVNQVGENADAVRKRVAEHMPQSLRRIIALSKERGADMGATAEDYAMALVRAATSGS